MTIVKKRLKYGKDIQKINKNIGRQCHTWDVFVPSIEKSFFDIIKCALKVFFTFNHIKDAIPRKAQEIL